jgi:hypothetical protein
VLSERVQPEPGEHDGEEVDRPRGDDVAERAAAAAVRGGDTVDRGCGLLLARVLLPQVRHGPGAEATVRAAGVLGAQSGSLCEHHVHPPGRSRSPTMSLTRTT